MSPTGDAALQPICDHEPVMPSRTGSTRSGQPASANMPYKTTTDAASACKGDLQEFVTHAVISSCCCCCQSAAVALTATAATCEQDTHAAAVTAAAHIIATEAACTAASIGKHGSTVPLKTSHAEMPVGVRQQPVVASMDTSTTCSSGSPQRSNITSIEGGEQKQLGYPSASNTSKDIVISELHNINTKPSSTATARSSGKTASGCKAISRAGSSSSIASNSSKPGGSDRVSSSVKPPGLSAATAAASTALAASKLGLSEQLSTALTVAPTAAALRDVESRCCLHYAAAFGHEECVDLLLAKGGPEPVRVRDSNGDLPLHMAATHAQPMCAYSIAKACPACCLVKNKRGQTPIDLAAAGGRGEVLNALLLGCAGEGKAAVAVAAMRLLLQAGAVPDTWAPNGSSALMLAAATDGITALQVLLEGGATIELQDALGRSALMFAAGNNASAACQVLLDHNASLSARDRRGRAALDYAPAGSDAGKLLQQRLADLEVVANQLQQQLMQEGQQQQRKAAGSAAAAAAGSNGSANSGSTTASASSKKKKKKAKGTKAAPAKAGVSALVGAVAADGGVADAVASERAAAMSAHPVVGGAADMTGRASCGAVPAAVGSAEERVEAAAQQPEAFNSIIIVAQQGGDVGQNGATAVAAAAAAVIRGSDSTKQSAAAVAAEDGASQPSAVGAADSSTTVAESLLGSAAVTSETDAAVAAADSEGEWQMVMPKGSKQKVSHTGTSSMRHPAAADSDTIVSSSYGIQSVKPSSATARQQPQQQHRLSVVSTAATPAPAAVKVPLPAANNSRQHKQQQQQQADLAGSRVRPDSTTCAWANVVHGLVNQAVAADAHAAVSLLAVSSGLGHRRQGSGHSLCSASSVVSLDSGSSAIASTAMTGTPTGCCAASNCSFISCSSHQSRLSQQQPQLQAVRGTSPEEFWQQRLQQQQQQQQHEQWQHWQLWQQHDPALLSELQAGQQDKVSSSTGGSSSAASTFAAAMADKALTDASNSNHKRGRPAATLAHFLTPDVKQQLEQQLSKPEQQLNSTGVLHQPPPQSPPQTCVFTPETASEKLQQGEGVPAGAATAAAVGFKRALLNTSSSSNIGPTVDCQQQFCSSQVVPQQEGNLSEQQQLLSAGPVAAADLTGAVPDCDHVSLAAKELSADLLDLALPQQGPEQQQEEQLELQLQQAESEIAALRWQLKQQVQFHQQQLAAVLEDAAAHEAAAVSAAAEGAVADTLQSPMLQQLLSAAVQNAVTQERVRLQLRLQQAGVSPATILQVLVGPSVSTQSAEGAVIPDVPPPPPPPPPAARPAAAAKAAAAAAPAAGQQLTAAQMQSAIRAAVDSMCSRLASQMPVTQQHHQQQHQQPHACSSGQGTLQLELDLRSEYCGGCSSFVMPAKQLQQAVAAGSVEGSSRRNSSWDGCASWDACGVAAVPDAAAANSHGSRLAVAVAAATTRASSSSSLVLSSADDCEIPEAEVGSYGAIGARPLSPRIAGGLHPRTLVHLATGVATGATTVSSNGCNSDCAYGSNRCSCDGSASVIDLLPDQL